MSSDLQQLRNIGIVAHIDAGKTTLTERMLFYTGAVHRMGEVDRGTTVTDDDPEEQQRGITIYAACVTMTWNKVSINLIDTPGHVDFTAEVERSLRVLDGAVVVFSAREGVEAQSETVWRQADRYGVPRVAFINKMDREGADFERTLKEVRTRLGCKAVPLQMPIGAGPPHQEDAFRGIIDLVGMKLLSFDESSEGAKVDAQDIPAELLSEVQLARAELLESLYDYSNELMELGLEEAEIPEEVLHRVIRDATLHRLIVPVFCGSALDHIGVQPVLDAVEFYLPSPLDVPPVEGVDPNKPDKALRRKADADEPFCGLVFKVSASKFGDMCWTRIYSGVLKSNSRVFNPDKDKKDNVSQLWKIHASKREEQIDSASAGDIVGLIGPRHSVTGDTICLAQDPILLETIDFPETVISMAIEPESSTERKKLADTLEMMKRQDPTFRAHENEDTGQTLISGMGELHLEVIKHRLLREFKLEVKVHKPRVSYRETIEKQTTAEGECHRQIAGQNTFAKLKIKLTPLESGAAQVAYDPAVLSQAPPPLLAVAKEELDALAGGGGLFGNPLIRVRITITGAEAREPDSTEAAFRIAAGDAFETGLRAAGVVLLEPIMKMEISTPEENLGDLIADLQQRRALIHNTGNRGGVTVISAEAPLANLFGYSSAMRSLSQGRASCSMEPSDYGPAPPEILDGMV